VDEKESFLVAAALENWTEIYDFTEGFLDWELYKDEDLNGRVQKFIQEVPAREDLVARKVRDRMAYEAELKLLATRSHGSKEAKNDISRKVVPFIMRHISTRPLAPNSLIFSCWSQFSVAILVAGISYAACKYIIRRPFAK